MAAFWSPVLPAQRVGEAVPPTNPDPKAAAFGPEREALSRFISWVPQHWFHRAIDQAPTTEPACHTVEGCGVA